MIINLNNDVMEHICFYLPNKKYCLFYCDVFWSNLIYDPYELFT